MPTDHSSDGSVLPATAKYHVNAVATISAPTGLSGRRYQANRPTPVKPAPITSSIVIQKPRSGRKSLVASSGASASAQAAESPAMTQTRLACTSYKLTRRAGAGNTATRTRI